MFQESPPLNACWYSRGIEVFPTAWHNNYSRPRLQNFVFAFYSTNVVFVFKQSLSTIHMHKEKQASRRLANTRCMACEKQLLLICRPWRKGQIYKNWDLCLPRLGCPVFLRTFPHTSETATGKPSKVQHLFMQSAFKPSTIPILTAGSNRNKNIKSKHFNLKVSKTKCRDITQKKCGLEATKQI